MTETRAELDILHIFQCLVNRNQAEPVPAGIEAAKRRGVKLGRKPALSPEQVAHARKLVESGDSPANVARLLGVARSTLYKALAAH